MHTEGKFSKGKAAKCYKEGVLVTVVHHLQCRGSEILNFLPLPGEALFLRDGEGLHL